MKRIGILTFHRANNYGAVLQAFALCAALREHDVRCIDYIDPNIAEHCGHRLFDKKMSLKKNLIHFLKYYVFRQTVRKERRISQFVNEYIPLTKDKYFSFDQLCNIEDEFDILVSGSDQIWNPQFTGNKLDLSYFLGFGNSMIKKISFATSAGSYAYDESQQKQIKKYLEGYHAISVREVFLKEQLTQLSSKTIEVVSDPTLLLDRTEWRKNSSAVDLKSNYVLLYTFDNCEICLEIAKKNADRLGCDVVSISNRFIRDRKIDIALSNVGPQEFVWLFANAQFVVTNSFHGTIFSVIFEKFFFSVWKKNNPLRAMNLLKFIGLEERLVTNCAEMEKRPFDVNYGLANKRIAGLRNNSYAFLKNAIDS